MPDETTKDEGYAPTPAASSPPDVDLELDLQDQAADHTGLVIASPPPTPLGRSPAYDYARRAFVPNAAGGPLMLYGRATLASWLEKCIHTVQGENPAVDPTFGLSSSLESILLTGEPYDSGAAAEAQDVITEAFKVHPRVTDVLDFRVEYTPGDDTVFFSYSIPIEGDDEEPLVVDSLPVLLGGSPNA